MSEANQISWTDDAHQNLLSDVEAKAVNDDAEVVSNVDEFSTSRKPPTYLDGVSEPNRVKVEAHTQAFKEHVQKTTESVLAAGEEACAIKRILRRKGQFGNWVRDETVFSIDTVERYMNAYRRFGESRDLAILLGRVDEFHPASILGIPAASQV